MFSRVIHRSQRTLSSYVFTRADCSCILLNMDVHMESRPSRGPSRARYHTTLASISYACTTWQIQLYKTTQGKALLAAWKLTAELASELAAVYPLNQELIVAI